ncbi:MAG: hypothetical protein HCAMLNBO_00312 [Candidatus Brocadia fulgida]|nr:hypothetical protein [Candidatus Brocadia fulgida]
MDGRTPGETPSTLHCVTRQKVAPEARLRWINSQRGRVAMGVMTWQLMSGSGRIVGMKRTRRVFCAAAPGTMEVTSAGAPSATGTFRTTVTTMSDFVAPGLLNFDSFTL